MQSSQDTDKLVAIAIKQLAQIERRKAFDPYQPASRPNAEQDQILQDIAEVRHRYVLGGNQSGKTALGGRECAWVFTETHPYWVKPTDWGDEPFTMLVIARTMTHCEEIWEKKVRPFLDAEDYKETKIGAKLQRVDNPRLGHKILFFSHHSPEEAREKLQNFVAHWVWLDEMPRSFKLLEELHKRCIAKSAPFLATFTPKIVQAQIRKLIEIVNPVRRKYKLPTFANPIFASAEKREEILAEHEGMPEAYIKTVLEGDWYGGDLSVYEFDPLVHVEKPDGYSKSWRHLEIVDPAASGKAGFALLAENPATSQWFLVHEEYISGAAASDLLDILEMRTHAYNIVRRVSDPHEVWFIKEAAKNKRHYIGVRDKNFRKKELIKQVQEFLGSGRFKIAPWCELAIDEINTCQWSETTKDKIIGSARFHLLDCIQYGLDNLPKAETKQKPQTFDQALKESNRKRKEKIAKAKFIKVKPKARLWARRGKRLA